MNQFDEAFWTVEIRLINGNLLSYEDEVTRCEQLCGLYESE